MKKHSQTILLTIALLVIAAGVVWFVAQKQAERSVQNPALQTTQNTTSQQKTAQKEATPSQKAMQQNNTTTFVQHATTGVNRNADGEVDTYDWKEYCNEEYGFCVKYPEEWEVRSATQDACVFIVNPNVSESTIGPSEDHYAICPDNGGYHGDASLLESQKFYKNGDVIIEKYRYYIIEKGSDKLSVFYVFRKDGGTPIVIRYDYGGAILNESTDTYDEDVMFKTFIKTFTFI